MYRACRHLVAASASLFVDQRDVAVVVVASRQCRHLGAIIQLVALLALDEICLIFGQCQIFHLQIAGLAFWASEPVSCTLSAL